MGLFRPPPYVAQYEAVLGTSLELFLWGNHPQRYESLVLSEIDRLEAIYSTFRPNSELSQLNQLALGQGFKASADLQHLLQQGLKWWQQTSGSFQPALGEHATVAPYALRDGWVYRLSPYALGFNALAKGLIADRAVHSALQGGASGAVVNLGGDLRHGGRYSLSVALANPLNPADNAPPLGWLRLQQNGLASSGPLYRDQHLLNPHTQQSATATWCSVLAPDAASADALSTALYVLPPQQAMALANQTQVGALLVCNNQTYTNARWRKAVSRYKPLEVL